ncbi:MAG: hypothetical protein NVS2B17_29150 [Candidatus Velthaea sp.]
MSEPDTPRAIDEGPDTASGRARRLIQASGKSQAEIAKSAGYENQSGLRNYLDRPNAMPGLDKGLLLARALKVSPWFLAFGKEERDVPLPTERSDRLEAIEGQVEHMKAILAELLQRLQYPIESMRATNEGPQANGPEHRHRTQGVR